jgi:Na+/H+ antiporter NhaD/arsenite permease-like protein
MNLLSKIILFLSLFLLMNSTNVFASNSESVMQDTTTTDVKSIPVEHSLPDPLIVIPFMLLLLMIATGPVFYKHFWEHHYPKIAIILGLITVFYYLFVLDDSHSLLHTLMEYLSFIALLSSLFVASGGILIKVDKEATPLLNVGILLFGALISNVIGTTGASMLLIRPYIKVNQNRVSAYHIIFFIFLVSNIGGALTPIGDPPLFLGFLRGVPFFWVIGAVWFIWLPTLVLLLIIFYFIDSRNKIQEAESKTYSGKIEFKGLKNLVYLAIILISVFLDPTILSWVPSLYPLPFGIREIIMFAVVLIAYKTADKSVLKANEFDFEPIKEVAYLFVGIFATMIPALQLIANQAKEMGEKLSEGIFYWATGLLSGFLDNAPTYLNFLSASMGKYGLDVNNSAHVVQFTNNYESYLVAISVAAVFFGAMTYIGNGPNFMVKSISERAGITMPSFFVYLIKYAVPILLPIFFLVWLVFFI